MNDIYIIYATNIYIYIDLSYIYTAFAFHAVFVAGAAQRAVARGAAAGGEPPFARPEWHFGRLGIALRHGRGGPEGPEVSAQHLFNIHLYILYTQ